MNNKIKIKIDEKIVKHLEYFNENKMINDFLSLVEKNGDEYEIIIDEIENKDLVNLRKIELMNENEIRIKDANKIKLTFEKSKGGTFTQIWKCGRFFLLFFKIILDYPFILEEDLDMFISIVLGSYTFSSILKNENFKIDISKHVSYYYKTENYIEQKGSLGNSCMNDEMEIVGVYDNIENVNIFVVLDSSNNVFARALLWKTDKGLYLDRAYMINDLFQYGLYMYAVENFNVKYFYLMDDLPSLSVHISRENMEEIAEGLLIDKYKDFPYFDTFTGFVINNDNSVTLINKKHSSRFFGLLHYIKEVVIELILKSKKTEVIIDDKEIPYYITKLCNVSSKAYNAIKNTFNIKLMNLLYDYNVIYSGYLFGVKIFPLLNNSNEAYVVINDIYKNEFMHKFTYNIMDKINDIININRHKYYNILGYIGILYSDESIEEHFDEIRNKIEFMYVTCSIKDMKILCEELEYVYKDSLINDIIGDFFIAVNLNTKEFIIFNTNVNFINLLNKAKDSLFREYYKEDLVKIFGEFEDIYFLKFPEDGIDLNLKNELVVFSEKFYSFAYRQNTYFRLLSKVIKI